MAALLSHVLWIGGAPGAGKTTVATRIARRYGLRWYGADTQTWAHRDRALGEGHPAALRWEARTPAERWETATPTEVLEMSLHAERGTMIVDDVQRLPGAPLIVAEGSTISPNFVTSGVADRSRAVWLIATPELLRARLEERDLPRSAFDLYLHLASTIERQAREDAVPIVCVHESWRIDQVVAEVEGRFAAAIDSGARRDVRGAASAAPRGECVSRGAGSSVFRSPVGGRSGRVCRPRVRMRMRQTQL